MAVLEHLLRRTNVLQDILQQHPLESLSGERRQRSIEALVEVRLHVLLHRAALLRLGEHVDAHDVVARLRERLGEIALAAADVEHADGSCRPSA